VARIPDEIDQQMASTRVRLNDVLLNITGASIGRCCKYDLDEPANVNQHVCIIRPSKSLAPDYLSFYLQSDLGQRQIFKHQTKGNREGLNFQQLGSFTIPLPPMPFQKMIVETLAEIQNVSASAAARLLTLRDLKNSILSQSGS
jgi:type I restriction enzyme S subunit